jgi:hypothetical protein
MGPIHLSTRNPSARTWQVSPSLPLLYRLLVVWNKKHYTVVNPKPRFFFTTISWGNSDHPVLPETVQNIKRAVMEAISLWTLQYFCLVHGSTLGRIFKYIHFIILKSASNIKYCTPTPQDIMKVVKIRIFFAIWLKNIFYDFGL